ncbi:hypothetical protein EDC01DRAFT_670050 [Geopyxis carbonaria]|nr:hypothetical protein EDC01DRAFT_670050 [Geopyxis carbonaria]
MNIPPWELYNHAVIIEHNATQSCSCNCGPAMKALQERVHALEQGNEEHKAILHETLGVVRNQRTRIKTLELNHQDLKESAFRRVRFCKLLKEHRIEMSNAHVRAPKSAKADASRDNRARQNLEVAAEEPQDGLLRLRARLSTAWTGAKTAVKSL